MKDSKPLSPRAKKTRRSPSLGKNQDKPSFTRRQGSSDVLPSPDLMYSSKYMQLMQPQYEIELMQLEKRITRLNKIPAKLKQLMHGKDEVSSILKGPDEFVIKKKHVKIVEVAAAHDQGKREIKIIDRKQVNFDLP